MINDEVTKITLSEVLQKKKDDSIAEFKKLMQANKFDFDEQDENGKTLIMHLIESQAPTEFLWFCLEFFADPNIQDKQGNSPLHYAFLSTNKNYIYILLLFNADSKIRNNDDKEPFEMTQNNSLKIDEALKIFEMIETLKLPFAKLTRSRRDLARDMFTFIEGGEDSKGLNQQKFTSFNMWLNNDNINDAQQDAFAFFEEAKLPTSGIDLYYEEWIIALTKLTKKYNLLKLDEFFDLYKKVLATGKKIQFEF